MLSSSSGRGRLDLKRRPPFWLLPTTTPTALVLVSDAAALLRCAARRWEMTPPPPPPLLLLARAAMRDADWTMALMVIAIVIVLDRLSLLSLVMVGRGCCCVSLLFYVWCWKLLEEDGVRHFVVCCSSRHGQTDIVSLVILRFRDRFGCNTILDPM